MAMTHTIQAMKKRLSLIGAGFAPMRERHAALAEYASAVELGDALADKSGLTNAKRGAIVAALVSEHQTHGGELAQSLLVIAFEPALGAMRVRLRRMNDEDLDQSVLMSFVEALRSPAVARAANYTAPALVLETKRVLGRMLRPEKQAPKRFVDIDDPEFRELNECDELTSWHGEPRSADVQAAVERVFAEVDSERMRDVMMATVAGDESLRTYVDRCLPGVGVEERKVEYERLRRQRLAAITRLRMLSFEAPALAP